MLNRFFGKNTHTFLHVLGLSGLAFGIPLNKVVMSVSMMFLVLNLLLEADFKGYWKNLTSNRFYFLVLGFVLLHVVGLAWSDNMDYGMHDLRVKLPLLVIPTVLVAKPITQLKHIHLILLAFLSCVVLTSVINFGMYQHWFGNHAYNDIRGMSIFCSHVRYGLIVSMAIGISLYGMLTVRQFRMLGLLLVMWFSFYTFYSQVLSGLLTSVGVFTVLFIYLLWAKRKLLVISVLLLGISAGTFLIVWLFSPVHTEPINLDELPTHTAEGHPYTHYDKLVSSESGQPLYLYICEEELVRDWPKYSSIPIDSLDTKGQPIKATIIRYLSSKNLPKDAEGLAQLTPDEIHDIEFGIGSSKNYGFIGRLYAMKYQLLNETDPNNHSLLERFEYWSTGLQLFYRCPILGVGTGDVQDAFDRQYDLNNSMLTEENRHRAHNMFMTVGITFGILGLTLFLWLHVRFVALGLRNKNLLAVLFAVIILISFIMEDTLETQTGITFYGLFLALFATPLPVKTPNLTGVEASNS